MSTWRLAYSLVELRSEVNARWPNRNKASDGTIGDPSHAATRSDHNPNASGVVCAMDITNDPSSGPDIEYLASTILAHPQRDAKYIIWNRKIASKTQGWVTRAYTGIDPHTSHIHVSVGVGPDGRSVQPYDDTDPWLTAAPAPGPTTGEEDVLHLVKGDKSNEWWLTDWVTKRYINTADEAAQIIVSTLGNGGKIEQKNNGPVTYPETTVNRVPRNDV